MIVDAHRHYWDPARLKYDWLAAAPHALRRAFLPEDLVGAPDPCILVQAAPDERETRFLFELARRYPGVLGVVGWVDMQALDVASRLDWLVADGGGLLCGIRPMVQDIPDTQWLASPSLDIAFEHIRDRGLVFDALVDERHLRALSERLARHPGLHTVIDHAAKPDIAGGSFAEWATSIARLAQMPDVYCKLSGLLTLTGNGAEASTLEPYVAHLFETFGANRLIWGSDWPVLTTHASYGAWKTCARDLVLRHAPAAEAAVFGGNACSVYSLPRIPS
ncbi:amidohydrolase family protein [Luteibacter yeojuensis]|uniref:Amidohydrolase family protein n=1 Tax=Luteibacter yeojuensis TaxID=345309 RepID=A0A7X5QR69_9GAMM|nr:amidohydrolase family protein [Luteibacter yeojuensis]NID13926.1 amidohydrolase family protein [Luteibacter yeojuensis]